MNDDVLHVVRTQYEALEFLTDAARDGREVSTSFIRQLNGALTSAQQTYTATAPSGQVFQATLHHGEWKQQSNHVTRSDGSMLEYTPPEQVAPQMERLVALWRPWSSTGGSGTGT